MTISKATDYLDKIVTITIDRLALPQNFIHQSCIINSTNNTSMAKQHRVAPDVKEQIINRIKNDGVTVAKAAEEHGVSENTIYGWIAKKVDGVSYSEIIKLKRENAQLLQLVGEITLKLSETQKKK